MKIRKAIIPAAGKGTRFSPITKSIPKEMFPLWNRPAIDYAVEEAISLGIKEVIIVSSPSKRQLFEDYFKPRSGIKIEIQPNPNGLGDAIFRAWASIGKEPFAVLLPDVIFPKFYSPRVFDNSGAFSIMVKEVPQEEVSQYGIVKITDNKIVGAIEKPDPKKAPSSLAIVGRYILPPEIFPELLKCTPGTMGEIQLTEAINRLCQKMPASIMHPDEVFFDVGTPSGMSRAWEWLTRRNEVSHKTRRRKGEAHASL